MTIKSGTVLVSMELGDKLYFAADRRISWSFAQAVASPTKKIAKRQNVLLAGTGDAALCFEIVHRCNVPKYSGGDPDHYVFNEFLPTVITDLRQQLLVDEKERRLAHRVGSKHGNSVSILLGMKDLTNKTAVYEVDFSIDRIEAVRVPSDHTHGCGGSYALAIIQFLKSWGWGNFKKVKGKPYKNPITKKKEPLYEAVPHYKLLKMSPEAILEEAIFMAAKNSPGCDDNIDIEVL